MPIYFYSGEFHQWIPSVNRCATNVDLKSGRGNSIDIKHQSLWSNLLCNRSLFFRIEMAPWAQAVNCYYWIYCFLLMQLMMVRIGSETDHFPGKFPPTEKQLKLTISLVWTGLLPHVLALLWSPYCTSTAAFVYFLKLETEFLLA